ncbi:hypothetical protein C8T65DRAFT_699749 [Cerioporus squamosus]|nr:hypothetical protein C8T65DRAFT_699749 [Cerioporus squamosus]
MVVWPPLGCTLLHAGSRALHDHSTFERKGCTLIDGAASSCIAPEGTRGAWYRGVRGSKSENEQASRHSYPGSSVAQSRLLPLGRKDTGNDSGTKDKNNIASTFRTMATMDDVRPHLYLLADSPSRRKGDSTNTSTLVLFVNGPVATATFFLPTSLNLEADAHSAAQRIDEYLEDVRADALDRCDVSAEQEVIVRQLLLGYQTFFSGREDIPGDLYVHLTSMLVEAALSLEDHEPAEDLLVEIVVWLHDALPEDVFEIPLLPVDPDRTRASAPVLPQTAETATPAPSPTAVKQQAASSIADAHGTPAVTAGEHLLPSSGPAIHNALPSSEATSNFTGAPTAPTPQQAVTPTPPRSESSKVPAEDPALRKLFPQGVPVQILQAVLVGTSASPERIFSSSQARVSSPVRAPATSTPIPSSRRARVDDYVSDSDSSESASMPSLESVADSSDDDLPLPFAIRTERDLDTIFADGRSYALLHNLLVRSVGVSHRRPRNARAPTASSGPGGATASAPALQSSAPRHDYPDDQTLGHESPPLELHVREDVDAEGGYSSDGSMPSLATVSDSSDSDEEYVDDDDDFYDDV